MKHVKSKKGSELLGQILLWALLIGALLVFSVPFFFMISNSFEEFSYVLPYPPRLLPTRLDFPRTSIFWNWRSFRRRSGTASSIPV